MTIKEQLLATAAPLKTWAETKGGSAEVAQDPVHLFALLALTPGSIRACVIFKEELKRGDYEEAGFVDRTYTVVLSRGKGFTLAPADSLIEQSAGGAPMFDLIEEAREVIRALSFDAGTTEVTPNLKSITLFQVETSTPVDAYQIDFSIGSQLPAVNAS